MGILCLLLSGKTRFGEIADGLPGASSKVLTQKLRELERDGLVRRENARVGTKVRYFLTEPGRSLAAPLRELAAWAVNYERAVPLALARHGLIGLSRRPNQGVEMVGPPASQRPLVR